MNFRSLKYLEFNFAALLLLLLFFTEAYFKIVLFSKTETLGLLQVSKGIIVLCLGLYILVKNPKKLWLLGLLSLSFILGQVYLEMGINKEVVINFAKLLYPLILLIYFNTYTLSNNQKQRLFLVFERIMIFNSLLIFTGLLFDINIFKTYLGSRFGFNGLFVTSATSSYVYGITLIYLLEKYKSGVFKHILNLIIIGAMFCIGTKVSYGLLIIFFAVYLLKFTKINKKRIVSILLVLITLLFYVVFFKYGMFNEIRQKVGLISSIMSYRDILLTEHTIPYIKENWSVLNYMFGGVSDLSTKSQIEFIDIFYFFGILGGLLYYYIFFKAFLVANLQIHIVILLSVLFIIVLLAGNFFSYPSIAIYLVVLSEYFKFNEQNQHI